MPELPICVTDPSLYSANIYIISVTRAESDRPSSPLIYDGAYAIVSIPQYVVATCHQSRLDSIKYVCDAGHATYSPRLRDIFIFICGCVLTNVDSKSPK